MYIPPTPFFFCVCKKFSRGKCSTHWSKVKEQWLKKKKKGERNPYTVPTLRAYTLYIHTQCGVGGGAGRGRWAKRNMLWSWQPSCKKCEKKHVFIWLVPLHQSTKTWWGTASRGITFAQLSWWWCWSASLSCPWTLTAEFHRPPSGESWPPSQLFGAASDRTQSWSPGNSTATQNQCHIIFWPWSTATAVGAI